MEHIDKNKIMFIVLIKWSLPNFMAPQLDHKNQKFYIHI